MKRPWTDRVGDFMAGKGFYIVLFLCVAVIGISGYYLIRSAGSSQDTETPVAGQIRITVTPRPTPAMQPEHSAAVLPRQAPVPSQAADAAAGDAPPATAAPTPAPSAPLVFTWPVKGELLSTFSLETLAYDPTMEDWRTHAAIDIACDQGIQVLATARGTVLSVEEDDLMGTTVTIDHGEGLVSVYANLEETVDVAPGDAVFTGDIIGRVGKSAIAESALADHLHFAVLKDGVPVDPVTYLPGRT